MSKIVIGFSRPRSPFKIFSAAIRLLQGWTPYSHCYVLFDSESLGVPIIYQASGMQVNFMGLELFKHHAITTHEFELTVTEQTRKDIMIWAVTNAGKPYGIVQIAGMLIQKISKIFFPAAKNPFSDGQRTIVCSELVGYILRDNFSVDLKKDVDAIDPKDVFDIVSRLTSKQG